MTALATLQADLEQIKTAYRSGATRVAYSDKSIEYRDASEMRAAIASIENEIAGMTGANMPRTILVRSKKGW